MASIIKVDRILDSTELGKVDIPGGIETTELIADTWKNSDGTENYKCRAWVNFDGTTTPPTIRASGNVSSVARTATGNFTINFVTPMKDANYSVSCAAGEFSAPTGNRTVTPNAQTPSSCVLRSTISSTTADINTTNINVAIFR